MPDFAARRTVMVDTQVRPSDVTKYAIIQAMLDIPREAFVPDTRREAAYAGENMALPGGRVMLDPRTLAKALDALDVQPDELALVVGAGLGYSAAVLARLADAVIAVEDLTATDAEARLTANGADNAVVIEAPLTAGAAKHGPYDVILIEGGVEQVPAALTDQLKDGGRIAALFMRGNLGTVRIGYRAEGVISWRDVFNASAPILPQFTVERSFVL